MRQALVLTVFGVAVVVMAEGLLARAKPLPNIAGEFTLRETVCTVSTTDRALGDCAGIYTSDTAGTTVILNTNREFRGTLGGTRFARLDLSAPLDGGTCAPDCAWRPEFGSILDVAAHMQTNVVTEDNVETVDGLARLDALGEHARARFYFTFPDPAGRGFNWSVLFNPGEQANSDLVHVTNIGQCRWRIEAPPGTRAALRGWTAVKKGRGGSTDEGIFDVSFAIDFLAVSCGA